MFDYLIPDDIHTGMAYGRGRLGASPEHYRARTIRNRLGRKGGRATDSGRKYLTW